ncbi:MAG: phosphoribosylanthranilate isomerase [Lentisphaeria bacterium]|nr:phosphoribosylanthranilate isomerase [Lentisphaeria bacterium]
MVGARIARVQIAGVHDASEALLLAREGVEWIGIPLCLAVHREDVTDAEAAAIVAAFGSMLPVTFVLITYLASADAIRGLALRLNVRHIQMHGETPPEEMRRLRAILPDAVLIKSLIVGKDSPEHLDAEVARFAPVVDAFITDTYDPATGATGATGMTHDWAVSRRIVECSPRPVILAGGLTPANVAAAIRAVRPAGVDAHTGVEGPDGRKDAALVRAFVQSALAEFDRTADGGE